MTTGLWLLFLSRDLRGVSSPFLICLRRLSATEVNRCVGYLALSNLDTCLAKLAMPESGQDLKMAFFKHCLTMPLFTSLECAEL